MTNKKQPIPFIEFVNAFVTLRELITKRNGDKDFIENLQSDTSIMDAQIKAMNTFLHGIVPTGRENSDSANIIKHAAYTGVQQPSLKKTLMLKTSITDLFKVLKYNKITSQDIQNIQKRQASK